MRPKSIIFAVLLLPVALVGAVTYYIRGEARQLVGQVVGMLAPFADIRYGSVSVSFGGEIRLHDVDARLRLINDSVRIESIQLDTPGLWFLLTGTDALRDGQLPAHARLELRGAEVGLRGALAEALDQLLAAGIRAGGTAPMTNCGEVRYLDSKAHRELGYGAFMLDITIGYRFTPRGGPLQVEAEWRTRELGVANVDLEFSDVGRRAQDMLRVEPRLRRVALRYQDLSFTERVKRFCAEAGGMTVAQYVEAEVERSDGAYQAQWGFVPGAGLRQAYRSFLDHPGTLSIEATASNELELRALRHFKPDDVASMLNLQISVNDQPVTDLSWSAAPDTAAAVPPPAARPAAVTPPAPASEVTDGFRATTARELGAHIGHTVRLYLTRGVVREGKLLQILQGMARLERRYAGGATTLVIPLREIERAEVQVRPR
jgi:hypothetical protein